ncbi:MAG: Endonuclease 4 [Candidatus Hinthialibacteria bacterium OLB16]|nr:MAG: Endonuclease 4 [Candidatus Hinthialibacteria bacterium OLB16]MBK7494576.1 deoxyribonuclease IV [Candidatus Omnitrophota bacterium]
MLFGSHISTAGGVDKAFKLAESLELEVMQIFTRNQNQWNPKPLAGDVISRFLSERDRTGISPVFSHGSYLINLCSTDETTRERSELALQDELMRCDLLEIPYLVLHPGSHMGQGENLGIEKVARAIDRVFSHLPDGNAMLLLENTAGQGSNLGYRFEQLAEIRDQVEQKHRIGFCFDTCHAHAAGYDMLTEPACRGVFEQVKQILGFENLKVFHFNDSVKPLGSRVDRHEHIGKGSLGTCVFGYLLRKREFKNHPMALETPKSPDYHEDRENLAVLKSLISRKR